MFRRILCALGFSVFFGGEVFANKLQYKFDFVIILVYTIKSRSQVYIVARGELPTYMSIDNKT